MNQRPGACIPETMRFNGQGIEYESSWDSTRGQKFALDCSAEFTPYFNARTLSTGAEVSLWIWQQYLANDDRKFLADNYPVMASSARFLLSYQKLGRDGLLHTSPSNAHETQWDVTDPTTDIAAAMALYPVTIQAATLLGRDADLVRQLQEALPKIPPLPRTEAAKPATLLPPSADADGTDMIAESYLPGAPDHNGENIGLETVWPYDLIGDTSPLFELAKRTYEHRLNPHTASWSFDPIHAARLDMGSEVGAALIRSTENSAHCINGFTGCTGGESKLRDEEFYVEQSGVAADALQESLVQDYDGLIRIAPAIPPGWDFDGSVLCARQDKGRCSSEEWCGDHSGDRVWNQSSAQVAQSLARPRYRCCVGQDRRETRYRCHRPCHHLPSCSRHKLSGREARRADYYSAIRAYKRHAGECSEETREGSARSFQRSWVQIGERGATTPGDG